MPIDAIAAIRAGLDVAKTMVTAVQDSKTAVDLAGARMQIADAVSALADLKMERADHLDEMARLTRLLKQRGEMTIRDGVYWDDSKSPPPRVRTARLAGSQATRESPCTPLALTP